MDFIVSIGKFRWIFHFRWEGGVVKPSLFCTRPVEHCLKRSPFPLPTINVVAKFYFVIECLENETREQQQQQTEHGTWNRRNLCKRMRNRGEWKKHCSKWINFLAIIICIQINGKEATTEKKITTLIGKFSMGELHGSEEKKSMFVTVWCDSYGRITRTQLWIECIQL